MPGLPIPVFGALVLLFLFLRLWLTQRRLGPLSILLAVCGLQALVIAMAQHYQVPGMRYVQPVTATFIPPLAWLAYLKTAVRPILRGDALHAFGPGIALTALLTTPAFLDIFIPAIFVAYGAAILIHAARGPDVQPRVSLESAELPARIWVVIAVALIASAFSDLLIVAAQAAGAEYLQPWIISLYSVGNLILIGSLSLSGHLQPSDDETVGAQPIQPEPDEELWSRIERYMADKRPYLDPDLTLSTLSRRMGIPAKTMSTTINRATKGNVSRYVNDARIEVAKRALLDGEPVTGAMLTSGFNTKSNFNREFLRVTGTSPSKWLADQQG
ncbi:AraC family transcriptional regulator [Jannaschia sp. S6380]|uniref:helix-turn-helix domain-containing protein n=1 Tax=Jannaschia sp. S6380 TaxID=2926408 RepID=UPI001FF3691B|nr:AraC family transcriptional regulator [Jannaschia sp. S6380]MCK0167460.1 AraC family transcriptional regulator [Jannaschia sp. S6380]